MVEILTSQVFSKDFIHEALMEFIGRYPKWLRGNRDKLSKAKNKYEHYEKQLGLMVNLTVVYENEPQEFSKIINIMQNIQECGMPPSDIIADIFPGLDLSTMGQW
ncbi:peroxisome biogenesis protein 19-1-like [Phragmites australis]|uniref:peroxisome biogenesis protein 19-1-like n=1 Tax=Phragmites australis TaxID=29695 RepID=UPI002D7783CE|nr:peroxisome biogenesis protein 19-1-like [Phragmites australis]